MEKFEMVILQKKMNVLEGFIIVFLLSILSLPSASAYSAAWCESCHQLIVKRGGLFAYNESACIDLTRNITDSLIGPEDFTEFMGSLGVVSVGNVVIVYSNFHDSLHMGIYNGSLPIKLKPVLSW
ncbi:hypothetical protein [Thermococcus sp. LS2]|uniref:hypothetical protein n=1 Tax=Thermococcus sp. LS2 TaxID=1638260 RepID=UPI00143B9065|nr:hypothetical protein [Thermococcus sp. LS2]NJE13680.1 hypothetical protein [Thermococcus sp. LS2]